MSNHSSIRGEIVRHYGTGELANHVREALQKAHSDSQTLTSAQLAPLDQFHVRGLAATREMADALGPRNGATVLDIGCGLGDPPVSSAEITGAM